MKILVLYHPNAEFARMVEQYSRDFERSQGYSLELVSLDSRDGADTARLYGVVRYPAVLAINQRDKSLARLWEGEQLPLMSEVASYARQ